MLSWRGDRSGEQSSEQEVKFAEQQQDGAKLEKTNDSGEFLDSFTFSALMEIFLTGEAPEDPDLSCRSDLHQGQSCSCAVPQP
jgi:hypothetical protein